MPSNDDWPERFTEDGDKLFHKDKPLAPENRVEDLINCWHKTQWMHPGRDKLQKDLESKFLFPPGYFAVLNPYCKACVLCTATKHLNRSTAGNVVYTAIVENPMRKISMDDFTMPEVTGEGEVFDRLIFADNRHSGYIVAVLDVESKKKDKRDKHGVGLRAKGVAQAMMRHCLTVFDVPAVRCSDRGTQFVCAWFRTMCKYMPVRHAKMGLYHSRSSGRAESAGRQLLKRIPAIAY